VRHEPLASNNSTNNETMKNNASIAREYVKKFPSKGNRTIANALYADHPERFATPETARCCVRYVRGAIGNHNRKHVKIDKNKTPKVLPVPKSSAKPRKPFKLKSGKILVMSDVHIPYHDVTSVEACLEHADAYKPDCILLNGDTIDFYGVSRWEKDPEVRNLPEELKKTRQFLMHLRARFPDAEIIWKNGNHEERWEKYLWNNAPELCGVEDFELQKLLRFDELGIQFVHGRQRIKAGKHLTIIHGHEIPGAFDPVNFARTLCTKLKVCAMAGHKHKVSEHTEKDADGTYISCWSTGCFEEMTPDYMPINNWSHGFATIELDGNDFDVSNYRIIEGRVR